MRRVKFILFLAVFSSCVSTAQDFNRSKLDSFVNAVEVNNKSMGTLAISKNGSIVYQRSLGFAHLTGAKGVPSSVSTKYRIGSITKMFTAVLAFQLIESGRLSLDGKLSSWYPGVPNAEKITVEHLLGHRSGIHNFTDDKDYILWAGEVKAHPEMIALISANKPDFEPGVKASYSNSNYVLLGYILEKISGKKFKQLLQDNIVKKISLQNTYYGSGIDSSKNEALSYRRITEWSQHPQTDMSIPGAAGAIVSTPGDLVKFVEALFDGKLVKHASLTHMQKVEDGYGLGMFQMPVYDKKSYGHSGGIDGFTSLLGYLPEDKLAFSYCSNGNGGMSPNDIILGALSIYFDKEFLIPDFKKFDVKPGDLESLTGNYESADIPLKIQITLSGGALFAQATGQSQFPLEPSGANEFKFDPAGIVIRFSPEKKEMVLKQGGATYLFNLGK